ncbi:MAG: DUF1592 domain-containing protein [Planctomycetota bacterium]|nr:MAG: DUF1592 domain-containing protein [Planctomycetota bacterium]
MSGSLQAALFWAFLLLSSSNFTVEAASQQGEPSSKAPSQDPILNRYCLECHSGDKPKAGLDLSQGIPNAAPDSEFAEIWRERIGLREMPPAAYAQPTEAERQTLLAWFSHADKNAELADPGPPVLRRLNNAEYRNAVRDIFRVDFPAHEFFPPDAVGFGFDTVAESQSLSDLALERYLEAAEQIVATAFVLEDPNRPAVRSFEPEDFSGSGQIRRFGLHFTTRGSAHLKYEFPRAGDYLFRVQASGDQAGPDPCFMDLHLDGQRLHRFEVRQNRDQPEWFSLRQKVEGGRRRLSLSFVNDYYHPDHPDRSQRDRNLWIQRVEIVGPIDPIPQTSFQTQLFQTFGPELKGKRKRAILRHLAERAWRRPVTTPEVARLEQLAPRDVDFTNSIALACQAILISPHFLFRLESDPVDSEEIRQLNGYEMASRLSFFLWSTTPDPQLHQAAAAGELQTEAGLRKQVQRMLLHPKSRELARNFGSQWLQLRSLEHKEVDPDLFPEFDQTLRQAMVEESLTLFEVIIRSRRNVYELLDADYTYVNEALASLYGMPEVKGTQMRRVSLKDQPRRGLLTHAGILTLTSQPNRTSPVKRGLWVLDNLLGTPPPPPPPNTPALDEGDSVIQAASLRERLAQHRQDPACAACHDSMDPLGLGLENFDPLGRWRDQDGSHPIDASGELPDGRRFQGPLDLIAILQRDPAFLHCLTEKLYVYALGRGVQASDGPILDQILAGLNPQKPTFADMVEGIILSPAFRFRRVEQRP